MNNPQQTSTCNIPFVPNYGIHPGAPAHFLFPSANKPCRNWMQASADALKIAQDAIVSHQARRTVYVDQRETLEICAN